VAEQSCVDLWGLAVRVAVQHQVQVQAGRDGGVDEPEEARELLVAVPAVVLGDHRAAGLDLALLIHAQHQGVLRRRQVQPGDVADLLDELRVRRQLRTSA